MLLLLLSSVSSNRLESPQVPQSQNRPHGAMHMLLPSPKHTIALARVLFLLLLCGVAFEVLSTGSLLGGGADCWRGLCDVFRFLDGGRRLRWSEPLLCNQR